tara:strand:+ start:264 stop:950 length:687 start_codon:yes stop_codon:yes gene_type:complete
MASSYLVLINNVLRDLNEVELTSSTFSSSRGIQTAVKDYVNRAIDDIINADTEWPFTVINKSFTTAAGTRLYTRSAIGATNTKTVDFDSFTFLEAADKKEITLEYITYSEYLDNYHERDTDPTGNSRAIPVYVYEDPQNNIGLSPVPDKATYTVKYYYYATHTALSSATDTSDIPDRFENVIIERAKYYAFSLRGDLQNAQLAQMQFEKSIKRMRVELINKQLYMRAV